MVVLSMISSAKVHYFSQIVVGFEKMSTFAPSKLTN